MIKLTFPSVIIALTLCFNACENSNKDVEQAKKRASISMLKQHTEALAHDSCQGRKPFSIGADRAVKYISTQMKEIGLQPGGDDGGYLQKVKMILSQTTSTDANIKTTTSNGRVVNRALLNKEDFVVFNSGRLEDEIEIKDVELVFAGYGINAPEFGKNDFIGITNPQNKIAVVMVNDPGLGSEDTSYFEGDAMTYYGRWMYKFEEGARQKFKGVLIIHEDRGAGYGWSVVKAGANGKLFVDKSPDKNGDDVCPLTGWIHYDKADELFKDNGLDLAQMIAKAKKADFIPVPLKSTISLKMTNEYERKTCNNVVGYVPAKDKNTKESIVYLAHWDHLGYGSPINGDSIINGASDNATAVAWLLEMGRCFNSLKTKPSKNIIFISPTCEETGFHGTKYYINNPLFPIENTAVAINLDVIPLWGENNDVTITGYGHFPELDSLVGAQAVKYNRYVMPDPESYNGMFFRSDHFPFMQKGVPAIFAKGWSDNRKHGKEWSTNKIKEYWRDIYHKPLDQTNPKTDDYGGLMQELQLFFDVGYSIAK